MKVTNLAYYTSLKQETVIQTDLIIYELACEADCFATLYAPNQLSIPFAWS